MLSGELQNIQVRSRNSAVVSSFFMEWSVSKTDETRDYNRGHSRARVEEIWTHLNSCEWNWNHHMINAILYSNVFYKHFSTKLMDFISNVFMPICHFLKNYPWSVVLKINFSEVQFFCTLHFSKCKTILLVLSLQAHRGPWLILMGFLQKDFNLSFPAKIAILIFLKYRFLFCHFFAQEPKMIAFVIVQTPLPSFLKKITYFF